ncbi:hypothetical protein QCN23_21195, partial [Enterobacter bugandensis]
MKSWVKMNSWTSEDTKAVKTWFDLDRYREFENISIKEGANKQVISSQADSLIKISRIWAD